MNQKIVWLAGALLLLTRTGAVCVGASAEHRTASTMDAKAEETAPADDVVKGLLQKAYATSDVGVNGKPYYTITVTWKTLKNGTPHEGTYWADGVPPKTHTMVYPVKAEYVIHRVYNSDGSKDAQSIVGQYGFFKDEFGEWTFRSQKHEGTRTKE